MRFTKSSLGKKHLPRWSLDYGFWSGPPCLYFFSIFLGSSGTCVQGSQSSNNLNNKYCGDVLNGQAQAAPITINVPVCGEYCTNNYG